MKRLTEWLATMPSTNTRIAVTLLCVLGTGVRYWTSASWVPDAGWLAFLAAMSGIDVLQFHSKRTTQSLPPSGTDGPTSPPSRSES